MGKAKTFQELFEEAQRKDAYWEKWLISDFIEALARRMDKLRLSRSALAVRLKTSPAYVTKVLRGDANFTVQSMAKLARAADSVVRIHLAPMGMSTRFVDIATGGQDIPVASSNQNGFVGSSSHSIERVHVERASSAAAVAGKG